MFAAITLPRSHRYYLSFAPLLLLVFLSYSQPGPEAVDGTTGAPLGGIGCGAIKFCAHNGTFAGTWRTPCALDNFQALPATMFQFYSKSGQNAAITKDKLTAVITGGRADDDAVYPVHKANFGTINGVSVSLIAFNPWDLSNIDLMCYPYAFYQIKVTNTTSAAVDAAVALQASLTAASEYVPGKGIKNEDGVFKRAVYVTSDDPAAVLSAGNDNGFLLSGQCNNTVSGATNKVAVKVTLAAGQSRLIKFVYAWHNNVTGFEGNKDGMFYYLNKFTAAGAVADTGLAHFDRFRDNAVTIVSRMRASNFPDWIKNKALVTLANLTNNSMYRKDGRYAHTEGMWATNGTMDQMFHARQIYTMLVPSLNWQELRYWARTQKINPMGQIHHDIDSCTDIENYEMSRNMAYMCPWDAQQHHDYREIDKWVDLNCAFIISVYEAFIATADTAQLNYFWPFVKKAGQRILDQLALYNAAGDGFPNLYKGTENSYDADGMTDINFYNSSLAIVTYRILSKLAEVKADADKQKYDQNYEATRTQFAKRYLKTATFPSNIRVEAISTGQWLSYFLKLGELSDSAEISFCIDRLNSYYNPLTKGLGEAAGTYSEWAQYKTAHFGGLCLEIGKFDIWKSLQYDWYQRIFNNRNLIYNIPLSVPPKTTAPTYLATNISGYDEYISSPVVWRMYYSMVGYHRNRFSGELWLEPTIPLAEMNHSITNAAIFSPEGNVTMHYTESKEKFATQKITIIPDNPINVTTIYVKDKGLPKNYVRINGGLVTDADIVKTGTGFAKELKIKWQGTIPASGLTVTVSDDENFGPVNYHNGMHRVPAPFFSGSATSFSIMIDGHLPHTVTMMRLDGKTIGSYTGSGAKRYAFGSSSQYGEKPMLPGVYCVQVLYGNTLFKKRFVIAR